MNFLLFSPVTLPEPRRPLPEVQTLSDPPDVNNNVNVEIRGAGINSPGIYSFHSDSTVIDLIARAGGLSEDAYTETIPFHQQLHEDLKITIPTREILTQIRDGHRPLTGENLIPFRKFRAPEEDRQTININTASHYSLQELKGIGPVLAGNIIRYREEEKPFQSTREIQKVPGIGKITYEEIVEDISVR